jgi:hypothetical protein
MRTEFNRGATRFSKKPNEGTFLHPTYVRRQKSTRRSLIDIISDAILLSSYGIHTTYTQGLLKDPWLGSDEDVKCKTQ